MFSISSDACSACDPIVKKTTDLLTKACTEYDYGTFTDISRFKYNMSTDFLFYNTA